MSFAKLLVGALVPATCLVLPLFVLLAVYRVRFHPLGKYPGPLVARLSDAYAGYYALKRTLHLATFEDHLRHGNVMRYGPDRLVFNTATALRDIYQNPRVTKSKLYTFSNTVDGVPFIFTHIDRELHQQKRKIIGPFLAERSVREFGPVLEAQIDIFLKQLLASRQDPVNLTDFCSRLGLDIAAQLGFGYQLELQTREDNRFISSGLGVGNYRIHTSMNFPLLGSPGRYLAKNSPTRAKWAGIVEKMMKARVAQDKYARHDYYSYVMDRMDLKPGDPQHSELFAESLMFMSAGGDTISTALAALFFYLSRNRTCYDRLAQEIRSAFKDSTEIQRGPKLSSCFHLRACFNEALRMSPPVGGTLWRQLADGEDDAPFVVDGHVIPPGTHVGVNVYSIHHNKEYFPEPFEFKPERWIAGNGHTTCDADEDNHSLVTHRAFTPFSLGSRSCAGKSMAYLEGHLVMAKTFWYFDFERAPGSLGSIGAGKPGLQGGRGRSGEFQLQDMLTSRHDGPYLIFKPRTPHCAELKA
ncbi:cytochrome P450 [Xylariomycetidae sp. FL0641]|nr:cytochrome P450 [Xylariomycetidae sp. FL0641]